MKKLFAAACAAFALGLSGCATSYGPMQMTGGYSEKELEPGIYRVVFAGNGYTTAETTQTYWLYRCAELSLSKGYQGFRILTPIKLTALESIRLAEAGAPQIIKAHGGGGGGSVYVYSGGGGYKPALQGDIQMLHAPITTEPSKVFDAAALKAVLEPYVTGNKCSGNVCPHVHRYLYPVPPADGKTS